MAESSVKYVKMLEPHVDPRFGKLAAGRIVPLTPDMYDRWSGLGLVEDASEKEYKDYQEKRVTDAAGGPRGAKLRELAAQRSAQWDTATHRDALTAPEENLKVAMKEGRPLVNVDQLKDADGLPLQPDAKLNEILEARSRLQERDPLRDHTQSSVNGGGSHFYTPKPLGSVSAEELATGMHDHEHEHPARKRRAKSADSE